MNFSLLLFVSKNFKQGSGYESEEEIVPPTKQKDDDGLYRLKTPIPGTKANHSFSGIMFDVRNCGIEDVVLKGVAINGEIGPWRVFCKSGSCREEYDKSGILL